jgi:hypothetical protein
MPNTTNPMGELYVVNFVHYRYLIHDSKPTKRTDLFRRYSYYNITQNTLTCFGPLATIIRESDQIHAA